ncbi:MAG: penicillin-binding protein 1C [Paracoccaceae bacterium]|nr:penicillin-binding protein 1C [Paracoccaceae bacterium]
MIRARQIVAFAIVLWAGALARDATQAWVTATVLPPLAVETATEVLARDGQMLRAYTVGNGRWRMAVEPGAVDPAFIAMLVAFEDKGFFRHSGIDLRALGRAVAQAVWNGRIISGGSTLTMQVARLLEDGGTGRVAGKLRQMRVALALERRLSKTEILQLYLHLAPYGGNLEGVRAASLAYFGKEPGRLTPAEAALLVALPQSPEARRPDRAHQQAVVARKKVLQRAVAAGIIAPDQALAALEEPVPSRRRGFPALAPHLADRVLAEGVLAEGGAGRRHLLTIDAGLQARLEDLAAQAVAAQGDRLQVAILVADHRSGEVLASVGSAGYQADARQGFIDMTQAVRSPGSTLKPLIYGLAFDEGLAHPETLVEDRPMDFGGYAPQNFDRIFRGTLRVREALHLSLNIPVVAITDALGPAKLMAAMRRAGVEAQVPGGQPGLAIALGGLGVTLQDLVQIYAALARGGVALPLRVTGKSVEGQRVLGGVAAWQVGDILSGMPPPGGAPANRLAYKTGTSYGHRDAWAIGYDGRHVVGIWMGRADGTPVPGAFGGDLAAPILFQAFARIKRTLDPLAGPPAATLLVSNAQLPQPLQRFRSRSAAFEAKTDAPSVAFPPDGAEVEVMPEGVLLRVRGGIGPFTWLADGVPVAVAGQARAVVVPLPGPGFVTLSVIDGKGQSARAKVRLR